LYLVSYSLSDVFSVSKSFVRLLEIIIEKIKNDMAQGIFIRSLIDTSKNNPEEALKIFYLLTKSRIDTAVTYSGLILGGMAKKEFTKAYKIIEEGLETSKITLKVACLRALRVVFEDDTIKKFPKKIMCYLEELSKKDYQILEGEVIKSYVDFDKFEPEQCEKNFLRLQKKATPSLVI
jgi:hypothetical protein